jgi:NTP pyrophosphatase (non-canonical NTP hydrolase)
MDFNEYQRKALVTAIYPEIGFGFVYPALGLSGEVGEISEKVKKICRDKNGHVSNEDKDLLIKEVGDVLWYLSALAIELGFTLNEAAEKNIEKLYSRKERGVLGGSGDNR